MALRIQDYLALSAVLLLGACGAAPDAAAPETNEPPATLSVAFSTAEERVDVALGGNPFTSFHYEEKWDKPFLYPLRTASGTVVSRGYPIEPRPGEHSDHVWHRGIWWGHGVINGVDFWREQGRDKTGRLVLKSPPRTEADSLTADMSLQTPAGSSLGSVRQSYRFSGDESRRVIDATIEIRADQGVAVTFGDTEDGGFGIRLADPFRQDMGAMLTNAQGLQDAENIWGRNSEWVDYAAFLDNRRIGVVVFDHPQNLRHPTGWHARDYSLNAANPFAAGDFSGDDANDGSYTILDGETLTLRYRVTIYEDDADLQALYQAYAAGSTQR